MFFCSLVGVIVISIMVVAVTNKLEMTKIQKKVFTFMNKLSLKEKMRRQAAKVITQAMKLHLQLKRKRVIKTSSVFRLSRTLFRFRHDRM